METRQRMTRSYKQDCLIAHALDLLGERWTLLVIRELLLGPLRFAELQSALQGIGPTILSKRLKDLEDAGLVERADAKGRYRLSEQGSSVRPVLISLVRFSVKYFLHAGGREDVRDFLLSTEIAPDSVAIAAEIFAKLDILGDRSFVAHLVIDDQPYTYFYVNGELTATRGDDAPAAARIESDGATLMRLIRRETTAKEVGDRLKTSGDADVVKRFIDGVLKDAMTPEEMKLLYGDDVDEDPKVAAE